MSNRSTGNIIRRVARAPVSWIAVMFALSTGTAALAAELDAGLKALRIKDFASAARVFEDLSTNGSDEATYLLAGLYRRGLGVPQDIHRSAELYERLAGTGHEKSIALIERTAADRHSMLAAADDPEAALLWAAQIGDVEATSTLLNRGVSPDIRGEFDRTPLMEAAEAGHTALVPTLVGAGANPDLVDRAGDTAIILAAMHDRAEVVSALLEHGADASLAGSHGNTPLIIAARRGNAVISETLVDAGVPVNAHDDAGRTAMALALVRNHRGIGRLIAAEGGVAEGFETRRRSSAGGLQLNVSGSNGRPLWFIAAERGDAAAISSLLSSGVDIDRRDERGETALMIAADRGWIAVAERLLDRGADVDAVDHRGEAAAHKAAAAGNADMLKRLLDRTNGRVAPNADGENVLMLALASGSAETAAVLKNYE